MGVCKYSDTQVVRTIKKEKERSMRNRKVFFVFMALIVLAMPIWAAGQQEAAGEAEASGEFDWKRYEGQEIHFLANNNPIGQLFQKYSAEFTELTGIEVTISLFAEQQYRQRLQTIMQAKSDEVDLYMSLVSREGDLYDKAGWYQDLYPMLNNSSLTSPDYDFADIGEGIVNASVFDGRLTGVPNNIEGPVLYYRSDILNELGIAPPKSLDELEAAVKKVKAAKPDMVPFASRGLAAAAPYTFSNFLHNMGGDYVGADGKSALSTPEALAAIELYARLQRDYGPPGVINYSFPQLTALNSNGQSVFNFQSSNEFGKIMESGERTKDTEIMALPPGPGGSTPVVIGWQLSISPHSERQELAWYFLQWATSKEMQVKLGLEGLAPPRTSVWESDEYIAWLAEEPVRQQWSEALTVLSQTGSSVLAPQIILQPETRQIIGEAVGSVTLNEATPQEAAKKADQLINVLIERSAAMQ
jgi:multiple sugar transport system substrate-binding protein